MNFFDWLLLRYSARGKGMSLIKRGMDEARKRNFQGAIGDCSSSIGLLGIPADVKAMTLCRRDVAHMSSGDDTKGKADLDAVLGMEDAIVNVKTIVRQRLAQMKPRPRN